VQNRIKLAILTKFPVNFPVSREFKVETGSTASATTHSAYCGAFLKACE